MVSTVEVFEDLAFDVEDFHLRAPESHKRFEGPHTFWTQTTNTYFENPYVGYKEYFPVSYTCLTRDSRTGLFPDPVLLHDVMTFARIYITKFRAPYRVALMAPGTFGWVETAGIFADDSRSWNKLLDKFYEQYRYTPQALVMESRCSLTF